MTPASYYAPRAEVRINGLTLAADVSEQVISVSYDNNIDLADMFTVVLQNPDNRFTDLPVFDLGKTVEIHMGYGNDLTPMMLGEITSLEPAFPQSGAPTLTVAGYDKSYKMRHNQPDRPPFRYMTDSVIAAQLALENLLIPIVDPSPFFHEYLQQTDSDMAFLKERASANFFQAYVHWDKLYFQFPRPQLAAYVLEWGDTLSSFTPRLANGAMAGLQIVRGYNEELAQTIVGFATSVDLSPENILEKLGSSALEFLLTLGRRVIRDQPIETPVDALALAKSVLQAILDGMYEGSGSCIGIPELRANRYVNIRNVGKRFSGTYRLSKVTHTLDAGGYRTSFDVTQKSGASLLQLLRKNAVEAPPPDRQQPMTGVVVGKVVQNVDPKGLGRVQLQFPWFSDTAISNWARCATVMAGSARGTYFLPDIGDEVLVAFQHGNFEKPVVLGSLWNGVQRPPEINADGLNRVRVIKSKSGHTITLDDTLAREAVVIRDRMGNQIALQWDGSIAIDARQTITLNTPGNVEITAGGNISMTAANVNVSVTGAMNVT